MSPVLKNVFIKLASITNLESILNNEQSSYDIPWSKASIEACFADGYSFYVMESEGLIIGHMIVQWVLDEAHLHNVCVIPKFQSQGLGSRWMLHLIDSAKTRNCSVVFLEVRESNQRAIKLYSGLGFGKIGLRNNYYQTKQGKENGLVMELKLTQ